MREKEKIDYILRLGLTKRMVHTDFLWLTSLEIFKSCRFKILKYSEVVFANFTSDIPKIGWENWERERERESQWLPTICTVIYGFRNQIEFTYSERNENEKRACLRLWNISKDIPMKYSLLPLFKSHCMSCNEKSRGLYWSYVY